MKKLYTKPLIEVNEFVVEENITASSIWDYLFGSDDILEDQDAYDWEWVD